LTLVAALIFQLTLSPYIKVDLVHPDVILIVTVSWVILRGLEEGIMIALFAGLGLDITSGAPFGIFSLTILLTTITTNVAHDRIFGRSSLILPATLILPLSFLFNGIAAILLAQLGRSIAWSLLFTKIIIPVAFLNTAVMLPVYSILYFLNQLLSPLEE
jgi:rod shape-determining protein MreD